MGKGYSKVGKETPNYNGKIKLATSQETNFFLIEAEKYDNYQNQIYNSIHNITSRIGMYYEALYPDFEENKRLFIEKWINFFCEKNETWWILRDIQKNIGDVWILPLSYSAEAGMPHTRGECYVCVPGGFFDTDKDNITTLRHELIHIHQKHNKEEWDRIYLKSWNWEPWNGKLPEKYNSIRRLNPDTEWANGGLYVIKKTWVPFSVFEDVSKPNIQNTKVWYYNINTGMIWKSTNILDLPPELSTDKLWNDSKINMAMREHPIELAAWLLASPEKYSDCPLMKTLIRIWPNID